MFWNFLGCICLGTAFFCGFIAGNNFSTPTIVMGSVACFLNSGVLSAICFLGMKKCLKISIQFTGTSTSKEKE